VLPGTVLVNTVKHLELGSDTTVAAQVVAWLG
jgi:hypothetical protein